MLGFLAQVTFEMLYVRSIHPDYSIPQAWRTSDGLLQTKLKTRRSTDIGPAGVSSDYSRASPATACSHGGAVTRKSALSW
jgi:hypothetical protein